MVVPYLRRFLDHVERVSDYHIIQANVRPENVVALYEAANEFGWY